MKNNTRTKSVNQKNGDLALMPEYEQSQEYLLQTASLIANKSRDGRKISKI